jgi:hypothetical protein
MHTTGPNFIVVLALVGGGCFTIAGCLFVRELSQRIAWSVGRLRRHLRSTRLRDL